MSWIRMLDEKEAEEAGGRIARLYRGNIDPEHGVVDNVLKVHSLRPLTLDGHLKLYRSVLHDPGTLDAADRETISILVSATNHCRY